MKYVADFFTKTSTLAIEKYSEYIEKLKNPNLRFRGSSNQKIYQMSNLGLTDITEQIDNDK